MVRSTARGRRTRRCQSSCQSAALTSTQVTAQLDSKSIRHCSMLLQCALVHAAAALHPNGVKIFYDPRHANAHSNAKGHPRRRAASTTAGERSKGPTRRGSTSNKRGLTPRMLYDASTRRNTFQQSEKASRFYRMGRTRLAVDTYAKRGSHATMLRAQSLWLDAVDHASINGIGGGALAPRRSGTTRRATWPTASACTTSRRLLPVQLRGRPTRSTCSARTGVALLDFDVHHGNGVAALRRRGKLE